MHSFQAMPSEADTRRTARETQAGRAAVRREGGRRPEARDRELQAESSDGAGRAPSGRTGSYPACKGVSEG